MDEYRRHLFDKMPGLAIEFFAAFSRFEFALKRGGFLSGKIDENAGPDWDSFAGALGPEFFAAMRAHPHAKIFFEAPPKSLKRISKEDVEFRTPESIGNGQQLFVAVRRVRNNLFHGEKPNIAARDISLMEASLFVLDSAMARCYGDQGLRRIADEFAFAAIAPP